jgi:hypothetical protein
MLQPAIERAPAHSELMCGLAHVAAVLGQDLFDERALDLRASGGGRSVRRARSQEIAPAIDVAAGIGHEHRALDACASSRTLPGQACAGSVAARRRRSRERLAIAPRRWPRKCRPALDVVAPVAQRRQVDDDVFRR